MAIVGIRYRCPARRNMSGAAEVRGKRSVRFVISADSARIWPGITASGLSRTRDVNGG